MSILKAINTEYKGYRFRSRLEARWAVFFDACGVEWEYEPEGYDLGDGIYYLPDFLLHDVAGRAGGDLYVEVKGNMSDADAEKINRFISIGAAEAKDYGKIQTAILVVGKIPEGNSIDDIISFICTEAYQNRKEPYYYNFSKGNMFWREADTAQLKSVIDIRYLPFSSRNHDVAFTKTADDRHFHPVRDYLDALPPWDGVKRIEDLFIRYLKADDTEYVRAVTRKTFAAAVARIYVPGIKFDCVPVLDGDQGIGKSTIVKDLVTSEYYSETLSLTDMDDKSGAEKLQGFWVVEIGELAGMKKADIEKVKAFLSTSDDKYRPSYGRVVESHLRQCIIIATVNGERGYLRDITGNRRFWIIKVHQKKQKKSWNFDEAFRAQFWAEAKEIWQSGEKLYLEGDVLDEAEKAQRGAMEADERVGMIEEYLNTPLPDDWDDLDIFSRKNFLNGTEFGVPDHHGKNIRTEVSNAEIWCECFGKNLQELKPQDSYAIAAMMAQVPGWERTTQIRRQPLYGRQRLYRKTL